MRPFERNGLSEVNVEQQQRHGAYALYRKNRLYYVGLASNLCSGLAHHLK